MNRKILSISFFFLVLSVSSGLATLALVDDEGPVGTAAEVVLRFLQPTATPKPYRMSTFVSTLPPIFDKISFLPDDANIRVDNETSNESHHDIPVIASKNFTDRLTMFENSRGRFRLLQQFVRNPVLQQPNMDELPITVNIKLVPVKIQDLIERNEVLETTLRLQLTWVDKRLSWEPRNYSNLNEIVVPAHSIWVPDIAILNSVIDVYHVVRDMRFEVKIEHTGRVWWHPTGIVRTTCKLMLRYYPFDKQNCRIIFESPTLDIRYMNLTLRSKQQPIDMRMFSDGETWKLLSFAAQNVLNQVGTKTWFTRVEFSFFIERTNIYHVVNFILPALTLSSMQIMFFLLPATHPQRVGSSTTILLSVIVFQTVVVSQLPKTSTDIPLLSIYIFCVIIVSGLSVGTSVFVAKFAVFADKNLPLPHWVHRIPHPKFLFGSKIKFGKRPSEDQLMKRPRTPLAPLAQVESLFVISDVEKTSPRPHQHSNQAQQSNKHRLGRSESQYSYNNFLKMRQPLSNLPTIASEDKAEQGAVSSSSTEGSSTSSRLFRNWIDLSNFVDYSLMFVAATMAIMSPIVLFVILPALAKNPQQ